MRHPSQHRANSRCVTSGSLTLRPGPATKASSGIEILNRCLDTSCLPRASIGFCGTDTASVAFRRRLVAARRLGGAVLAFVRPDETTKQHTSLHSRIAGYIIDSPAFAVQFVRASPRAHENIPFLISTPLACATNDARFKATIVACRARCHVYGDRRSADEWYAASARCARAKLMSPFAMLDASKRSSPDRT